MGPLTAVAALLSILMVPMWVLNVLGGVISGAWLLFIGQWWALGYGLALLVVSTFALAFALMPSVALQMPAAFFLSRGWKLIALPFSFLASLYVALLMLVWSLWVFHFYMQYADSRSYIPLLFWSYGTSTGPWTYMASKEGRDNYGSMLWATAAQVGYIVMILMALFASPTLGDLAMAFGAVAIIALIVQYSLALIVTYFGPSPAAQI